MPTLPVIGYVDEQGKVHTYSGRPLGTLTFGKRAAGIRQRRPVKPRHRLHAFAVRVWRRIRGAGR